MADLITSARALQNLNNLTLTTAESNALASLMSAVSKAIQRYCRRDFTLTQYDELYSGHDGERLILRQLPIVSVARVACGPFAVLRISNTATSNQRATVAVTSTGLTLVRTASGTTSTDTLVTWSSQPTLAQVATAVSALGNGWTASVVGDYGSWSSGDLRAVQGALNVRNFTAELHLYARELSDFTVDTQHGWLLRRSCWPCGIDNFRIIYSAGFATIPEDIQEACAEWTASLFWQTKDNPASYPTLPPEHVRTLLDEYRLHGI